MKYDEVAQCVGCPCFKWRRFWGERGRDLLPVARLSAIECCAVHERRARGACRRDRAPAANDQAPVASEPAIHRGVAAGAAKSSATVEPPPRPLRRCFPDAPSWVDAPVAALLDRAAEMFDGADYEGALACAEEAARQAPRSVEAHHNRAVALLHLDRLDEARDALALALALAPDDPETLEAAADLNINQLAPSADRSATRSRVRAARQPARLAPRHRARRAAGAARGAGAGRPRALARGIAPHRRRAAVAPEAGRRAVRARGGAVRALPVRRGAGHMFERVLASTPDHGHALYHLGLIEERVGDEAVAAQRLAEATARDPKAFPPPPADLARAVRGARAPRGRQPAARRRGRSRRHPGPGGRAAGDRGPDRGEAAAVADDPGAVPRPAARLEGDATTPTPAGAPPAGRGEGAPRRRQRRRPSGRCRRQRLAPMARAARCPTARSSFTAAISSAPSVRRRRARPRDHPDAAARGRPPARRGRRIAARPRPRVK